LEGFEARMLPGISCVDTIICDLGIDPGTIGLQVFLADSFVRFKLIFDKRAGLLLLQPTYVKADTYEQNLDEGINELVSMLGEIYGLHHEVVVYKATTGAPVIRSVPLSRLGSSGLVRGNASIFVPPLAWGNALRGWSW
jgi:hypothetical protein